VETSRPPMTTTTTTFDNEDDADRVGIRPILNPDIWALYKVNGLPSLWAVEEVTLVDDIREWNTPGKISDDVKHFVKYILSFFHGADKLVADNISSNFVEEVNIMEAQIYYRFQAMVEDIHSDMYSTLVDTLVGDQVEKDKVFNALAQMPVIAAKADWTRKYSDRRNAPLVERLVAFAVVEGVFFSGSFCAIFYIRQLGILPGLCLSNDFISRDEGQHCEFACLMYSKVSKDMRLSEERIHAIFKEAVDIEKKFVTEAIPVRMINMNEDLMSQYIEYVADFWIVRLGYEKLYGASNPFPFMVGLSLQNKTNFFESKVSEYRRPGGVAPEEMVVDVSGEADEDCF
jgi:ribonucleoside-diphosphate reductase beta chain